VVTLDWSAFDSKCPKWLLLEVWNVLEEHIDFELMIDNGKDIEIREPGKYRNLFAWVRDVFCNARLMLPNSEAYQLDGCIPSGSYFTQLIGSMVNLVVTQSLYYL